MGFRVKVSEFFIRILNFRKPTFSSQDIALTPDHD